MRDPKWISSLLTQSPFGLDTHFLLTLITKSLIYILLIAIQQQSIWFSLFNVVHWLICLLTCYNNVSFTVFHNVVLDGLRNLYNFKSTDFRPQSLSYPLVRGTLGGYPIPQYRTKNLLIPKYCVENLRNTDTAFMIGDAYLTLYPSRVFFFFLSQACIHQKSTSAFARKREISNWTVQRSKSQVTGCPTNFIIE